MFAPHHLLLADLADTLRVVMPIIFVVIYGVAHLVGAIQQEKKKRDQRPQPPPEPAELAGLERMGEKRPEPVAGKPATLEETLRREVEEFLKRAQGEPAKKPAAAPKRPPQRQRPAATQQPRLQQPPEETQPRRLVDAPGSLTGRPKEPAFEAAHSGLPTGAAVDAYVTEQMRGVAAIGQHASRLGEEVALADDRMQAQVQQKFDHRVGTLAPISASTVKPIEQSSAAAREFRELLARPNGLKQIIIANEIFRRPEERW